MTPLFDGVAAATKPFPHASIPAILPSTDAAVTLEWLRTEVPWQLRVESFYEQYEFSLVELDLPDYLAPLRESRFLDALRAFLRSHVGAAGELQLVEISAHKLVAGQTIRIHNDFLGDEETHRVIIQLNAGWSVDNGGILMLFASERAEDCVSAVLPAHGSGFAFEISSRSFHAVSTIRAGERYTLVYTFRAS